MLSVYFSLADIPEHGLLMFILGTLVLYPQCRIELSVMRQQMLESGGKKILLGADAAEGIDVLFRRAAAQLPAAGKEIVEGFHLQASAGVRTR